jgi:hypothetical protein
MKVPPYPPKRTLRRVTGPYSARFLHRLSKNSTKNRLKRDEKSRPVGVSEASSGFSSSIDSLPLSTTETNGVSYSCIKTSMESSESRPSKKQSIGSSPLAHARYLHDSGNQYVTVGQKTDREPWIETPYRVEKLYEVLPEYAGLNDVYLSLNRYYGSRKRIAELSTMYSDLDYYNVSELAHIRPEGVFTLTLEALEQAKIPRPSLAMSTGRGLALVWRHEPEPSNVLSKWVLCQQYIFEALKELGADTKAKDAARVFRLAGTYNSKSGKLVQSIFEDLDYVWEFGDLADEILPRNREQWKQHKPQLLTQEVEKEAARGARRASEGQRDGRKGFTPVPSIRPAWTTYGSSWIFGGWTSCHLGSATAGCSLSAAR